MGCGAASKGAASVSRAKPAMTTLPRRTAKNERRSMAGSQYRRDSEFALPRFVPSGLRRVSRKREKPPPKASVSAQRFSAEALFDLPPVEGLATRLLMKKRNARQQLAGSLDGQRTELNKPSALFRFGREGHAHGALNPA